MAKTSLNACKNLWIRDEMSINALRESGVVKPNIVLSSDAAFMLKPPSKDQVNILLAPFDQTTTIGKALWWFGQNILSCDSKNISTKSSSQTVSYCLEHPLLIRGVIYPLLQYANRKSGVKNWLHFNSSLLPSPQMAVFFDRGSLATTIFVLPAAATGTWTVSGRFA